MLNWVVTLLIAALLGFGGIAGVAIDMAKVIFFVALLLLVIAAVAGAVGGIGPRAP